MNSGRELARVHAFAWTFFFGRKLLPSSPLKTWAFRIWSALGVFLLSGCVTRQPQFPVGLYDVPPSDFAAVADAGFNVVVSAADKRLLDEAQRVGLQVIAHRADTRRAEMALDAHPALRAWYLYDEPDMHFISPSAIRGMNQSFRARSRHPTFVTLTSGAAIEKYRGSADMLAVDWYPVPWAPIATVAREMRLARLGNRGEPFYAIVQAFDWASAPQLLRTDVPLRPPTSEEVRCMTYLALMQGAAGIFFYSYDVPGWKLPEHRELWGSLSHLAREVRTNAPIFADRVEWWPVRTEYYGEASDMYNEILEARVFLSLHRVKIQAGSIRPGYYLVAVNSSAKPADFTFRLPFDRCEQLDTTCDTGDFQFDGVTVRKTYAPFEVCIFGPIQGEVSLN